MQLFDFLLDNLLYVIIVLGFISSLMAKKKKEEAAEMNRQNENVRKQDQPPTLDQPLERSTYERDPFEYEESMNLEPQSIMDSSIIEVNESVRTEAIEKVSPIYNDDVSPSRNDNIRDSSQKEVYLVDGNSISTKAVQGMMWAEVFGPPRAKKPYRSNSYRK